MKILVLCTTDSMIWNFLVSHIKRLEAEGHQVECACSITGSYYAELEAKGLIMNVFPFQRSPFNPNNIKAFIKLNTLVKSKNYDVIFCHEPVGGAMGRLVGHINHCKVVYMVHGFHFYKGAPTKMKLFYLVERFLSHWTDILVTINKEDFEASRKLFAKENILLNGIGVDTKQYKRVEAQFFEEQYGLSKDSIKLLSVGEMISRKNHNTVIEAMKSFKGKKIHYFIAGEGELENELKQKVNQEGLSEQVHFLGFRRNINELCNSCDIFVFPSVQEGLSKALMEAMACGKPIVASKIRGNVDLIEDGKGGYLVDTYDSKAYKDAIEKITNNPSLAQSMSKYNIEAIKRFDIQIIENEIVKLFK